MERAPGDSEMKESTERVVKLGFSRPPAKVVDEIESETARMIREGWILKETIVEESLGNIHLFFERDTPPAPFRGVS